MSAATFWSSVSIDCDGTERGVSSCGTRPRGPAKGLLQRRPLSNLPSECQIACYQGLCCSFKGPSFVPLRCPAAVPPPSWSWAKDSCHPSSTEGLLQVVQPPPAPSQLHAGPAPPLPLGGATSAADTESKARGLAHRALVWPWSCRSVSTGKWGVLASKRLPLLLPFPLSLCPSTLTKGQAHLQVRLAERTPHGWGAPKRPCSWCGVVEG